MLSFGNYALCSDSVIMPKSNASIIGLAQGISTLSLDAYAHKLRERRELRGQGRVNTKTRKHKHALKLKELVCVLILARIRKIRPAAAGRAC